jgi:hypothetical protein
MTTPPSARRPIEKIGGSYAREKLLWLELVARDPQARTALPLAVVLAVGHLQNKQDGLCHPGDKLLAAELGTNKWQIIRWRQALIDAGWLQYRPRTAGEPRDANGNHVLVIDPDQVTNLSPNQPDRVTILSRPGDRPGDNAKRQVVDSTPEARCNQEEPVLNQGRRHHHEKNPDRKAAPTLTDILNDRAARVAEKYGRD